MAEKAADELKEMRPEHKGARVGDVVDVRGVRDLEELVRELWPEVAGEEEQGGDVDRFEPAGCIPTAGAEDLASGVVLSSDGDYRWKARRPVAGTRVL